jgi:predicted transcriptional regulator
MAKPKKPTSEYSDPTRVSFRLDDETAAELARLATEADTSPSLYARDLVVATLAVQDEQLQEQRLIRHELATVAETLRKFRGDFASSMNLLLVRAGGLQPGEAQDWVRQTLLQG